MSCIEPVFVNLLRSTGIDSQPGDNPICCTGPPGYIGLAEFIPGLHIRLQIWALKIFPLDFAMHDVNSGFRPLHPANSRSKRVGH